MKFLSKSREVEAVQWTGTNHQEVAAFCGFSADVMYRNSDILTGSIELYGILHLVGDYIVKGPMLHCYRVTADDFELGYSPAPGPAALPDGEVDFHQTLAAYHAGLNSDPRFLSVNRLDRCDIVTVLLAVEIQCPHVEGSTPEESIAYARETLELNPLTVTLGAEELFHYSHVELCVGEEDPG